MHLAARYQMLLSRGNGQRAALFLMVDCRTGGWGTIPDQCGRRWADDDSEHDEPPNPGLTDLPPLQPWWGPQPPRQAADSAARVAACS